jgi:hypothetical protein
MLRCADLAVVFPDDTEARWSTRLEGRKRRRNEKGWPPHKTGVQILRLGHFIMETRTYAGRVYGCPGGLGAMLFKLAHTCQECAQGRHDVGHMLPSLNGGHVWHSSKVSKTGYGLLWTHMLGPDNSHWPAGKFCTPRCCCAAVDHGELGTAETHWAGWSAS